MDVLIALFLFAASGGDPVLAGGPNAPVVQAGDRLAANGAVMHQRSGHRRHQAGEFPGHGAGRAGDPVRLGPGFFATPHAGGVERPAAMRVYGRRGVIIIAPDRSTHPSASQAAAARGLPRG